MNASRSLLSVLISAALVVPGPASAAGSAVRANASSAAAPVAALGAAPAALLPDAGQLPALTAPSPVSGALSEKDGIWDGPLGITTPVQAPAAALTGAAPAPLAPTAPPSALAASDQSPADIPTSPAPGAEKPASKEPTAAEVVAAAQASFPAAARDGAKAGDAGALEAGRYFDRSRESWQKAAVPVEVAPEILGNLEPGQQQDARYVLGRMAAAIFTWQAPIGFQPPRSAFPADHGAVVNVGDLFRAPQGDAEVERIGKERRRFSAEQKAQVLKDATFAVDSQDFPGQSHLWQLGRLLQKGYLPSLESRRDDMAGAYEQLALRTADRIAGTPLSLGSGLRNLWTGLVELSGLAAGWPEMRPKLAPGELAARVQDALARRMAESARAAGASFDLALYDRELMAKAAPIVQAVEEQAEKTWPEQEAKLRPTIEGDLKRVGRSGKDLEQLVANALAAFRQEHFFHALEASEGLEALHPGLGRLLSYRGTALEVILRHQRNLDRDVAAKAKETEAALRKAHPVLSRIPAWLEPRVEAAAAEYRARESAARRGAPAAELDKAGFVEEARTLEWERALEPEQAALARSLAAQTAPAREFAWAFRIWNPRAWKVEKLDGPRGTYYTARAERTLTTSTAWPFWRALNVFLRAFSWTNSSMYHILVTNLWNGPLGLKSLFFYSPFRFVWQVNQRTGELELNEHVLRGTLASRVRALWAARRAILKAHAEKNNYGLFGKGFERFLLVFKADIGLGFLLPLIVVVGQPVLTILNVPLSLFLAATALLWTGAISILQWAAEAAVYDFSGTRHPGSFGALLQQLGAVGALGALAYVLLHLPAWLPIAAPWMAWVAAAGLAAWALSTWHLDGRSAPVLPWMGPALRVTSGAAVPIAAGPVGLIAHAVAAAALWIAGWTRWLSRRAWDWTVYGILIRNFARIPGRESKSLFRRIAGPGLSSNYFFQVAPDVAVVALWASMESGEHARYRANTEELLAWPVAAYEAFLKPFVVATQALRADVSRGSLGYARVADDRKAHLEALKDALRGNDELYAKLLAVPERSGIKMTAENLTATLKTGAVLAQRFYGGLFAAQRWTPEQVAAFWAARKLEPGDWVGVAKSHLAAVFGPAFLIPLEETDKSLRIEIHEPGLADYARSLENGIAPDELDRVRVDLDREPGEPAEPDFPQVGAAALVRGRH